MPRKIRPFADLARRLRVEEAKRQGIRIVPENPGPSFPVIAHACKLRPAKCGDCILPKQGDCEYVKC